MQRQELVIDRRGTIVRHDTDFAAVGQRLKGFITVRTWQFVKAAVNRVGETGEPERCVCEVETSWGTKGVVLSLQKLSNKRLRIVAREAVNVPMDLVLGLLYRVVLLRPDGAAGTVEHETPDKDEAVAWLDGWLDEPLGLVPAIIPPKK